MLLLCQQTWLVYAFLVTLYFVACSVVFVCLWLPITSSEVFGITFSYISHTSYSEISPSSQSNGLKCTLTFTLHVSFAKLSLHLQRIRETATPNHLPGLYLTLSQNWTEQFMLTTTLCTSTDSTIPPWLSTSLKTVCLMWFLVWSFREHHMTVCIYMWKSQRAILCDFHELAVRWLFIF